MNFLYFLEKIRLPGLNEFMLTITHFGSEIAFLVVALVLFWCISKRMAYYILSVGFIGTISNQFLKLFCRVPRPWVLDPEFTILEQARAGASGYSFPSGHTQSAVGTFGAIAYVEKKPAIRWVCIALAILVPFSRMYVGVHTPWDVLTAAAIALVLVLALRPVVFKEKKNTIPVLLAVMVAIAIAFWAYVEFAHFPADMDPYNMASGEKNAYTLLGAILGFVVVYFVDSYWLHFPTKALWWAQILKVVLGLALVLAVKAVLKAPLNALFGTLWGRCVRYFLVVITAGALWPMTFRWFWKLGKKDKIME